MDGELDMEISRINEQNQQYFASYENIQVHQTMIKDKSRTDAYRNAIMENEHLFKDKVVMDVGAGTGILSLFAARAGARTVYSIEATSMAVVITQVAIENGFSDVISVFHSKVEDINLQEKVDVIISEWMGFYLLHESMVDSVLFARDRFLTEDGILFPSEARIYACPCSVPNIYEEAINFWDDVYGFKMCSVKSLALMSKRTKPELCTVTEPNLLSDPICLKEINLRWVSLEELRFVETTSFVDINKTGRFHGLCLWFEVDFDGREYDENGCDLGSIITLSTSPLVTATHWKQTVVLFGTENDDCAVETDDVVGWKIQLVRSEELPRTYNITVEILNPVETEHPVPCHCSMPRCLIISKMIECDTDEPCIGAENVM